MSSTHCARAGLAVFTMLGIAACMAGVASAQRVLVETNSLTALGRAVRVYVHAADLTAGVSVPLPAALPGEAPIGPMVVTGDSRTAFVGTARPHDLFGSLHDTRISYLSHLETSPLRLAAHHALARDPAWRHVGFATVHDDVEPVLIALESRDVDDGTESGRLSVYSIRETEDHAIRLAPARPSQQHILPGPPSAMAVLDAVGGLAVLGRGPLDTGSWLHVIDGMTGQLLFDYGHLHDAERLVESEPGAMAVSADGAHWFVVTSGYAADSPTADPVSWLRVYDSFTLEPVGSPIELPGLARGGDNGLEPDALGGVWIATRWPVAGFAYVSHVALVEGSPVRDVAHSFTTTHAIQLAADPTGKGVYAGIGERLERWAQDGTLVTHAAFEAPIRVLRWSEGDVLVGEAGRLHRIDAETARSETTIQFQSGHVTDLLVLPTLPPQESDADADGLNLAQERQLGTNPHDPDTDFDGIPDGIDVEPLRASPLLQLPASLIFRGESVGRDVKSLLVNAHLGLSSSFRVTVPDAFASWLRVAPEAGTTSARVLVGIDPLHFEGSPDRVTTGWLEVYLDSDLPGLPATKSPQRVEVHVLPKAEGARRILWLWPDPAPAHFRNASDPRSLKALGDELAGAPTYFSHREHSGPYSGEFGPYAVVVVPADSLLQGVVNPHAILEYVARGGALLLLGHYDADAVPDTLRWLRPFGLTLDVHQRVDGRFDVSTSAELLRDWDSVTIHNGAAISAMPPIDAIVEAAGAGETAVFVAKPYGRGRVAALSASTPLASASLTSAPARQFARTLFRWLADAGVYVADADGDGLPDWLEDANLNGIADWGETHADRADSDGDGLPDGYEDANWNGVVDEGETNPLKADSDGDGIYDGADPHPVPSPGAPLIDRVAPASGPGEGGNDVAIIGVHLPADSAVWFGTRRSPRVVPLGPGELRAEAPPSTAPGAVDIQLTNVSGETVVIAPKTYTYQPVTELRVVLKTLELVETQTRHYRSRTSVVLDGPDIDLRRVRIYVRAENAPHFQWLPVEQGHAAKVLGRRITGVSLRPDLLVVDLHDSLGSRQPISGEIAILPWTTAVRPDEPELRLAIERIIAMTRNGELIPATPGDALQPLQRTPRPRRAPE